MAIVRDFMSGPTRIRIDDSCCVSKEEADLIMKELAKKLQPHMCYVERKRREKEKTV